MDGEPLKDVIITQYALPGMAVERVCASGWGPPVDFSEYGKRVTKSVWQTREANISMP